MGEDLASASWRPVLRPERCINQAKGVRRRSRSIVCKYLEWQRSKARGETEVKGFHD